MVVVTRASAPAVNPDVDPDPVSPFEHVLFLLGCGTKTENPDHLLRRILRRELLTDVSHLYALNPDALESMRMEAADGDILRIPLGYRQRLCAPVAFRDCYNAVDRSRNFLVTDWLNVTLEEMEAFSC